MTKRLTTHDERNDPASAAPKRRASLGTNLALLVLSLLVGLAIIEVAYRIVAGLPVLKFANWRTERVVVDRLGEFKAQADPVLGWAPRPHHNADGYTTLEHGIRRNFGEISIRTGGVLAVGDSFTEGWEVKDNESWPALLEKKAGVPVINAGVGAYGTDQIILRAEQLLPIVKPKVLIVGFLEEDIFRAGHSVFGVPKPHFTLDNGALRYHPPPVVTSRRAGAAASSLGPGLRNVLGYSAVADHLFARLAPDYWYGHEGYTKVGNDPIAVTCALLRRLKAQTDRDGARMILFMQYHATQILEGDEPSGEAQRVAACAGEAGVRVVDQFASLQEIGEEKPEAMAEYYTVHGAELYGHMTAKGNQHAADLLAAALRE